jgi:uncharacterized membrane protein
MKYIIRRFIGGFIATIEGVLTILTLGILAINLESWYVHKCILNDCEEAKRKQNSEMESKPNMKLNG